MACFPLPLLEKKQLRPVNAQLLYETAFNHAMLLPTAQYLVVFRYTFPCRALN